MRTSKANGLLFSFVLLTACGNAAAPRETTAADATIAVRDLGDIDSEPVGADRAEASEFLVWTREDDGCAETHRLDATGRELETIEGILIATPTGTWRWHEEDRPVRTAACERYDDEGALLTAPESEPGSATRATLEPVTTGAEQVLVEPPADADGAEDYRHRVELVASVGPWLFVRESTYVYACGAHGTTGVEATIWDASSASRVPRPDDLGSLDEPRTLAMQRLTEDGDGFPPTDETTSLTELVPTFAADGSLRLGLQFTSTTCYACGRGNGGSYTKSEIVDAKRVPDMLAPYADTPRAVRAFAAANPGVELRGWSRAE
jgi:hypothetical protein